MNKCYFLYDNIPLVAVRAQDIQIMVVMYSSNRIVFDQPRTFNSSQIQLVIYAEYCWIVNVQINWESVRLAELVSVIELSVRHGGCRGGGGW